MPFKDERPYPARRESEVKVQTGPRQGLRWIETTGTDDDLVDGNFAKTAVEWLENRDASSKPFFLAVGFHRPHLPLVAPAKYFDLYPLESITLPEAPADDEADIPAPARNGAVPGYTMSTTPDQRRAAIRGYLACVSYVDAQAGRVLEAIKRLGLADNTIVDLRRRPRLAPRRARALAQTEPLRGIGPRAVHRRRPRHAGQRPPQRQPRRAARRVSHALRSLPACPRPPYCKAKAFARCSNDPQATLHDAAFTQARRGANAEHWGRSVRTRALALHRMGRRAQRHRALRPRRRPARIHQPRQRPAPRAGAQRPARRPRQPVAANCGEVAMVQAGPPALATEAATPIRPRRPVT